MAKADRVDIIKELEKARGNRVCITYVTSTRSGFEVSISDDVVRLIYAHLQGRKAEAKEYGVDLFIHSNGGSAATPWRLVSMIREFTGKFSVLIPHHAFSAGTLVALGADEIVMHRMGCLGPIDPSVWNAFNPIHPFNPSQFAPISVEDVTSFFKFVKNDIGIKGEGELTEAMRALTDKVHPLALGNVQRHHQQARMIAQNLLRLHMTEDRSAEIDQIIDHLKSNISFHGHPINREEAKKYLKLKVICPPEAVEDLMWKLYSQYETELKMDQPFSTIHEHEVGMLGAATPTVPLTTAQIVQQMLQIANAGIGLGAVTPQQLVDLAVAMAPQVNGSSPISNKVALNGMKGAYIESVLKSEAFLTDMTLSRVNDVVKHEIRWQRWEDEK